MEPITPITTYRLTDHAQTEMARRHIEVAEVAHILAAPEHTEVVRPGRVVYQARVTWGATSTTYLLRRRER